MISNLDICHDYLRFAFIALSSSTSQLHSWTVFYLCMAKSDKSSWNWFVKKKYQRHKNDQNTQNRCWQLPVQKNTRNSYKMLIKCNQKIYTYAFIENTVNSLNRSPNTTRHGKYQTFRYVRMRSYREYI